METGGSGGQQNINSKEYWNDIYSGEQTGRKKKEFATRKKRGSHYMASILPLLGLDETYRGTIADFGCGLGFGVMVLHRAFPRARIRGVDHAPSGIDFCRKFCPPEIEFHCVSWREMPETDIIISSHVNEHLSNDKDVVRALLEKCKRLYVAVPYREDLNGPWAVPEHVNSYDEHYYDDVEGFRSAHVIASYPRTVWLRFRAAIRNLYRILARRRKRGFYRHIVFCFENQNAYE